MKQILYPLLARTSSVALLAVIASITLTAAQSGTQQRTQAVTKVGRYTLQSNPWVNLHQRLVHEVRFKTPPPERLTGDNLSKWKKIVETYRAFLRNRNPIFDDELKQLNAVLSQTTASRRVTREAAIRQILIETTPAKSESAI